MVASVIAFVVYSLFIVGVGVFVSRRGGDDEDYFLGGRKLGPWVAALSAGASGSSGWVTLGLVGAAFVVGVKAYWMIPGVLFGVAFNWLILGARLRDRAAALGAVTVPDLLSMHFRERVPILRAISVLVILASMFAYVAAQFVASGRAFEAAFGLPHWGGVLLGVGIVLAYSVSGGFRAVSWTDFFQALVMLLALLATPLVLVFSQGGLDAMLTQLDQTDPELLRFSPGTAGLALFGFLMSAGGLGLNFGYPGQPHVLVRLMALKERKQAFSAGVINIFWTGLVYAGVITTGLFARAAAEGGAEWATPMLLADPAAKEGELALVRAAMHLLPGVLSGLVLAAVLSAIASTADSQLVVAASAVANDLYARLIDDSRRKAHMFLNRATVLLLGLGAAFAVMGGPVPVFDLVVNYGWAMLGASFAPQVGLLVLWKRATYAGAVAGITTGFLTVITWPALYPWLHAQLYGPESTPLPLYNLSVGFILALAVNVVVSLVTSPPAEEPAA